MSEGDNLSASTRRRSIVIGVVAGIVLIALGAALFYFGFTFEEPEERLATRRVPKAAPIALMIGGGIVGLIALRVIVRSARRNR